MNVAFHPASAGAPGPVLVSVLVRSTGRPELQQALRSVAQQDYPHLEILVADAAATGTVDLTGAAGVEARVVGTGHPLARSAAANLLLREAAGAWVLFLDDDDWIGPGHLSRLARALQEHPQSALAYAGVSCVEQSGGPGDPGLRELRTYDEPFDADRLLVENYIPIHAALVNLSLLRGAGSLAFDESLDVFEDWDFWLQCLQFGSFVHVPGISAYYRIHATGLGVRMEEAPAVAALDALLARWAPRLTAQQRRAMVALGRNLFQLRPHLAELDAQVQGLIAEGARQARHHEQDLEQVRTLAADQAAKYEAEIARLVTAAAEQSARQQAEANRQEAELVNARAGLARWEAEAARLAAEVSRLAQETADERAQHAAEIARVLDIYAADVASIRRAYESSRSWRLTAPVRAAGGAARRMRTLLRGTGDSPSIGSAVSRRALAAALWAYKSPALSRLVRLVPFRLKRRVHQFLMNASAPASVPAESSAEGGNDTSRRVSIVIPVYNHAAYIRRCIQSALDQDWPDVEVIVVDDASPDPQVRAIVDSFAGHPRLRALRNERNLGISETQNAALVQATGGIIAFLDCDDFLPAHAISTCMRAWKEDTVYLHTGRINVDEQDREVSRIHFESLPREDYFEENLKAMYATHLKVIRRDAFAKVGLFDPRFDSAQDYEMLMRIAFHYPSSAFVHVPEFLYYHRFHDKQATQQQSARQAGMTRLIQDEARLRSEIRAGRYSRRLSFIMLSYGKHSQTLKAIQGLKATVRVPHEIILYDNGSAAETVDFLRTQIDGRFEDVRVVYGDRNLGPAQGRRKALDYATGDWIIVFDNDEWPEPGWLEELLVRAQSYPDVGAVCCKVVFPDGKLQFSGGLLRTRDDGTIDLALHDRGAPVQDLESCRLREVDWCPIGATLFTLDIRPFLHEGYPNVFEDAGVSFALKKKGLRLLNSPGSLVWHDHVAYMPKVEMQEKYMRDRYDPKRMLTSIASFYAENGLLIYDDYIWRENGLNGLPRERVLERLAA